MPKQNLNESGIIQQIADFCRKYFVFALPIVCAIGVAALIARNMAAGLPFVSLSVVQYAILAVYVIVFLAPPVIIGIVQRELYRKKPRDKIRHKLEHFIRFVGWEYLGFIVLAIIPWSIILGSVLKAVMYILPLYLLAPVLGCWHGAKTLFIKVLLYSAMGTSLILQIPISLGGIRPLPVSFCSFSTEKCIDYVFYGEANGLYQLSDNETIILIPTSDGYIKYNKAATY